MTIADVVCVQTLVALCRPNMTATLCDLGRMCGAFGELVNSNDIVAIQYFFIAVL